MNKDYVSCNVEDSWKLIASKFSERVRIIPILDLNGRIESIALEKSRAVELGGHIISKDSPCFVIAEIGINHNGDMDICKQLIDIAVDSGADCVKFQMKYLKSLYKNHFMKALSC